MIVLGVALASPPAAAQPAGSGALAQGSACAEIEVVQVPAIVGARLSEADSQLRNRCLALGDVRYQQSTQAPGMVIAQTPPPGTWAAPGAAVRITIAQGAGGPEPTAPTTPAAAPAAPAQTGGDRRVPDLTCRSLRDAGQILARSGLQLGRVSYQQSARCPGGGVVAQTPRPAAVATGGLVDVVIAQQAVAQPPASCPPSIRIPKIVGMTLGQAEQVLADRCLEVGNVRRERSDQPPDMVIVQAPSAGTAAAPGRAIDLVVAAAAGQPGAPAATPAPTGPGEVPDLLGLTITEATPLLRQQELRLGRVRREISLEPAGRIIGQTPAPGTPAARTAGLVDITIAESIVVPDLRRLTQEAAVERLRQSLLQLGTVTSEPSDQAPGTVIKQWPVPGMPAEAGQRVDLALAQPGGPPVQPGPPPVAQSQVPDLDALTLDEASRRLQQAGLQTGRISRQPSGAPAGTVIQQSPAPGAALQAGGAVDLVVAEAAPSTTPDLTGQTVEAARALLRDQDLELGSVTEKISNATPGQIIEQSPSPGSTPPPSGRIDVTVAAALTTPDLTGLSLNAAGSVLATRLLQLGAVTEEPSSSAPAGTIIRQSPAAGTRVGLGGSVSVTVALASTIPDLVGKTRQEAEAALAAARLDLGEVTYEAAIGNFQRVIRQEPAAGADATPGQPVAVVLAVPAPTPPRPGGPATPSAPSGPTSTAGSMETPSVIGLDLKQAKELLELLGLAVTADREPADPAQARILAQVPAPSDPIQPGGTIRVQIEEERSALADVVVPSLVGMQRADVEALLNQRLLALGQESWTLANADPDTVVAQQPPAGTRVAAGEPVSVTFAAATVVPDLGGLSPDSAAPLLISQSLQLGAVESVFGLAWPGTIIGQSPPAGAPAQRDAPVNVQVVNLLAPITIGTSLLLVVAGFVWFRPRGQAAAPAAPEPMPLQRRVSQPPTPGPLPAHAARARARRAAAPPSNLNLVAQVDVGRQVIRTEAAELVLPTVRLRGRADPGEQTIEPV